MPHLIVEHSQNLEASRLLEAVCQGAVESELFELTDIKTRAIGYQYFETNASQQQFVHVVVKILSGRTSAQRQMLSKLVLDQLALLNLESTSLTVEVVEMERESYAKQIN